MMTIKLAEHEQELSGILSLQGANQRSLISPEVALDQGFLTTTYDLPLLQQMHAAIPPVVAIEEGQVVGYLVAAAREVCSMHPKLDDLCRNFDNTTYKGVLLQDSSYLIVGQICVAASHRGQGMVQQLYGYLQQTISDRFAYLVCDVAMDNRRSLQAHLKTGFTVISTLHYKELEWNMMLWEWQKRS